MRRSRPIQSIAASPVMVGAVTTLIVIVAVFLAYNANNGLPFVPTYRVSVVVPNGSRLVKNNEVRIGGTRVGVVESLEAVQVNPNQIANTGSQTGVKSGAATEASSSQSNTCCAAAKLDLKLDKSASPLPKDSIFRVRYKSSFGLKYLEITRGTAAAAPEGFVFDGLDDTGDCQLPVDPHTFASSEPQTSKNGCFQPQTEFDAINNTFNTKTRTNARKNLVGYGGAFAARGASINDAIGKLKPLFQNLKPVSEVLASPSTELRRFFEAMGRTSRIVAPVAEQQADFFTQAAIAFDAISSDPAALRATISEGRPLLEQGPAELRRQRPFLADFAELSRRLRPGVHQLRIAIPTLNDAITVGTPVLNRSVSMNHRLKGVFVQLRELVQQPTTKLTLQRLRETFDTAKPLAQFVGPSQTVCNYWNYFWTQLSEHLTERDQVGFQQRIAIINMPPGPTTEQNLAGYSGQQANGRAGDLGSPTTGAGPHEFDPHNLPILHGNVYAPAGQPTYGQYPDCQGGQTGYPLGAYRIPGQHASAAANVESDLPGSAGVTDVFFKRNGKRVLKDTRIPSHQP